MIEKLKDGYCANGMVFHTRREALDFLKEEAAAKTLGVTSATRRKAERAKADLMQAHGHMSGVGFVRLGERG